MATRQPPRDPLTGFEFKDLAPVNALDDLVHPELRALFSLWKTKTGTRAAPTRQNLDVLELRKWLPHIQLVDVIEDSTDIRYRVIGTWIVERYGEDNTGQTMSEIGLTEQLKEVTSEFLVTATSIMPQSVTRPFYDQNGIKAFTNAERLMLPLSADGRTCNKVISAIYYLNEG
ncbi:PAS domain-containing protein [Nisaea sp.]|uniref:PAS domain-containing protein n=1 Tax=Nisaea sp. TaxID=2024842 RepID=UPI003299AA69